MTGAYGTPFLRAILGGSRREAHAVVRELREGGMELRELYLDVFQPALREVGRLWQEGRITVAHEHLATGITRDLMAALGGEVRGLAPPSPRPVLVAACADGEHHDMGLRMVADILEGEGWETHYLGSAVPVDDLVAFVEERTPDLVALSASTAPRAATLARAVAALRERRPELRVAVGGRAFHDQPTLAEDIGADFTALDAGELVATLERWRAGRRR